MALTANQLKWVEALESGEYKQATGVLFDGDGYCCLGVACHIAGASIQAPRDGNLSRYLGVRDFLGLSDDVGSFENWTGSLTSLNDAGKSFAEIAALIRSQPKGLFVKEGE